MGAKSFVTARLMETWAHGQDIVDTVGADRQATDRLRHVAQIGFITRGWSYVNRGLAAPDAPVFVELAAPSGETLDVGSRRARPIASAGRPRTSASSSPNADTSTTPRWSSTATHAREWMLCAQAFAGPPTDGPSPRTAS